MTPQAESSLDPALPKLRVNDYELIESRLKLNKSGSPNRHYTNGVIRKNPKIETIRDRFPVLAQTTHKKADNNVLYYHIEAPKLSPLMRSDEVDNIPLRPLTSREIDMKFWFAMAAAIEGQPKERSKKKHKKNVSSASDLQHPQSKGPKFLIYNGNNSKLIRKMMKRRPQWSEGNVDKPNDFAFTWKPISKGLRFERLLPYSQSPQILNHFEYHNELSQKDRLFQNLQRYWDRKQKNVFDYVPVTFTLDLFTQVSKVELLHFTKFFKYLQSGVPTERPGTKTLARLAAMPEREYPQIPSCHFVGKNMWLLKPNGFNRGRGIYIFDDIETLEQLIADYKAAAKQAKAKNRQKSVKFVIQKYIERPLLYYGRKFDIRVWVLISQEMEVYYFKEGYLRTSAETYSLDSISDNFVHLTNNAVQKSGQSYGQYEEGNQLSFEEFQNYLDDNNYDISIKKDYLPRIRSLITLSAKSVGKKLNACRRNYWFEIFGYDFIIDADLQMFLIEVNTNPCLDKSSKLLKQLIPRMLDDALKLTVDKIYPLESPMKPLEVAEKCLDLPHGNLWQYICHAK